MSKLANEIFDFLKFDGSILVAEKSYLKWVLMTSVLYDSYFVQDFFFPFLREIPVKPEKLLTISFTLLFSAR